MNRKHWEGMNKSFEAAFWGDCANSYAEETKQLAYANLMGLDAGPWEGGRPWPVYDVNGLSIVDIGGGPSSMLLKCKNFVQAIVVDPCPYPDWVEQRYIAHGVQLLREPAEDFDPPHGFDEAWMYNVLQHVIDPKTVVDVMLRTSKRQRVFEWIDVAPHPGHPHEFHADQLDEWFGVEGAVVDLDGSYRLARHDEQWKYPAWGGFFQERAVEIP